MWALACLQTTQPAELIKAWGTTGFLPGHHPSTEKSAASMQPESLMELWWSRDAGLYKDPTSDLGWDTSDLGWDRRTGWRIEIWGAESHYGKKKKTRHLLVCNWLHSAAFWMKGAGAEDNSPPFRLIHSNSPGIFWEMTAWHLQLIPLNKFPHSLMRTHKCQEKRRTQGKMLNCALERNNSPSLCRTATANSVSAALPFQPGSAL